MSEKPITEDITRMCNVYRDLGYIGALADEYYHDMNRVKDVLFGEDGEA